METLINCFALRPRRCSGVPFGSAPENQVPTKESHPIHQTQELPGSGSYHCRASSRLKFKLGHYPDGPSVDRSGRCRHFRMAPRTDWEIIYANSERGRLRGSELHPTGPIAGRSKVGFGQRPPPIVGR